MIQELIYTSAPQGLRPGSMGYCTVAMTDGMSPTLIDQLESLSGYRHVYPPQDPQAALNPVNFSCLKITVGGIRYTVLSRVADAGLDYSQRNNKIAHHVALDGAECAARPCGPAEVLAAAGFVVTAWEGQARFLPRGSNKPIPPPSAAVPCAHWERLSGDAGRAGLLVEAALRKQDVVIVFEPGMSVLPLVVEALALLEPHQRWDVTFSTYFTKLPPGIECRWRFVPAGSAEAQSSGRLPNTLVIRLGAGGGEARGGEYVQAARTGQRVQAHAAEAAGPAAGGGAVVNLTQRRSAAAESVPGADYGLAPAEPLQGLPVWGGSKPAYYQPSSSRLYYLIAGIISIFTVVTIGLIVFLGNRHKPDENVVKAERQAAKAKQQREHKEKEQAEKPIVAPPPAVPTKTEVKVDENPKPKPKPGPTAPPRQAPTPTAVKKSDPKVAFADLAARKNVVRIPTFSSKTLGARPEPVTLAKIDVDKPEDCDLDLLGAPEAFPGSCLVSLALADAQPAGYRVWNLIFQPVTLGSPGTKTTVADLRLDGATRDLSFQWATNVPNAMPQDALNQCILKVIVGGDHQLCALAEPKQARPFRFSALNVPQGFNLAEFRDNGDPNLGRFEAPLLDPTAPPTSEKDSNPHLKIEFRFILSRKQPPAQELTAKASPDGKSAVLSIPTKETAAPCLLEFKLASVQRKNRGDRADTTLGVAIAGSGKVYTFNKAAGVWELSERKPFRIEMLVESNEELKKQIAARNERIDKVYAEVTKKQNEHDILKKMKTDLEARKQGIRDPRRISDLAADIALNDPELKSLQADIKKLDDFAAKNPNASAAKSEKSQLEKRLDEQQKLLEGLESHWEGLTVHYRVYLDYPNVDKVYLYDTEPPPGSTASF